MAKERRLSYKAIIASEIDNLKANPVLFLPDIILFVYYLFCVIIALIITFYRFSGLAPLLALVGQEGMAIEDVVKTLVANSTTFMANNILQIIVSVLLFVFVTFILGVSVESIKFRMIKDVALKRKASLVSAWKGKAKYFWRIVLMKIVIYLLVIAATLVITVFSVFVGLSVGWVTLISIILFLFFSWGLLFRYAILLLDDKKAVKTIKDSFLYLRKNIKHVLLVWLIITVASIAFGIVAGLAGGSLGKLQAVSSNFVFVSFISFISAFVAFAIRLLYSIWSQLFIFKNYKN